MKILKMRNTFRVGKVWVEWKYLKWEIIFVWKNIGEVKILWWETLENMGEVEILCGEICNIMVGGGTWVKWKYFVVKYGWGENANIVNFFCGGYEVSFSRWWWVEFLFGVFMKCHFLSEVEGGGECFYLVKTTENYKFI